jgi:hypothetical protein
MLSVANDAMEQSFAVTAFRRSPPARRRAGSATSAKQRAQQRF